ncbi:MAG: type I methionyl aminopeptidase [Patescibacteria group bacterium]
MTNILNKDEIKLIKISGRILKESLDAVISAVKPGVSTLRLDEIAYHAIKERGAEPSFKDYEVKGSGLFPSTLCVSVNEEVVHGLPSLRVLKEGDVVSLDIGAGYKGVYTDMAVTIPVGKVSPKATKLIETTRKCLLIGINQAFAGCRIGDIGHAVQEYAEGQGFGVVRDLVGHGIGREPHMSPHIPNFGKKNSGPVIMEGMALAIEPMLTEGGYDVQVEADGWTITTFDGSLSAHFEHTVVILNGKPVIVTA